MGKLAKGFIILCLFVVIAPTINHFIDGPDTLYEMFGSSPPPTYDDYLKRQQIDGIYQVSISGIPSFADKGTVEAGISKAMMMWENSNPELKFELVEEHGKIHIEFMEFISRDVLGTEAAGYQEGRKLVIELGSYDCRGNWQQYSSNMIADTIAHETGHYLGLAHHPNESHLMYGHDEFLQTEFDDLGYNIPSLNSEYVNWIAYEELELRYNELERKYNPNPQTTAGYNQAMQIYNELNEIGTQMNCINN
jgi:hypothetical protein